MNNIHKEYDIPNRDAIEYYKTLSNDELNRLIEAEESKIGKK